MKCHHCGGSGEEPDEEPVLGTALEAHEGNGKAIKPRTHDELKASLSAMLASVQAGHQRRLKADQMRTIQAQLVFAYWQAEMGHLKALADDKRINHLKRCLTDNGGNVHELLYTIDGWHRDPTFKKMADEGRVLDGIENVFLDRGRIERLAGHKKGYREGTPHPAAVKYLEGLVA